MRARENDPAEPHQPAPTLLLLRSAQAGGRDAFGEVLTRYGCRIRHWLREAGVADAHDVEELEGDVQVKILKRLPAAAFENAGQFSAWVKTIAKNRAIEVLRRGQRSPVKHHLESLTRQDEEPADIIAVQPGPSSLLDAKERARHRAARIAGLTPPQRELIDLRENRGMSFAEIAEVQNRKAAAMGIQKAKTEGAVRMAYQRLLDRVGEPG
ncbi:MAG: sigma-70 family RNA polymerase sigma factor [Planctomycetota bacterium]|nr:sigma-70 family RNA polymerase sigma factor [Planctomycetota bacterium]